MTSFHVVALEGIGEVHAGDDLAQLVAAAYSGLQDGDIVVVTSKVVSKAEGRLVSGDKDTWVAAEAREIVAQRGSLRITRTAHGLVIAAAGVDSSNTPPGTLVLLPEAPDRSATTIRLGLQQRLGVNVGVVITDTAGRAWRTGQTDHAIGASGLRVLDDLRGQVDSHGNVLEVTTIAVADEIAAAADLATGKLSGHPVAVVRGLTHLVDPSSTATARDLVREGAGDLFRVGTYDVLRTRRTVREFRSDPVDVAEVAAAVGDAITAPAPHHSTPWRFVLLSDPVRSTLLDAMAQQWRADLLGDGFTDDAIERRLRRGRLLYDAPTVVVPCVVLDAAHRYPDERRQRAERELFVAAAGAGVQNFLVSLAVRGIGSAWVSSTMFCADVVREHLRLDAVWQPMGAIAIGYPSSPATPRHPRDPDDFLLSR